MEIGHLKTNHLTNPMGCRLEYLFFSWVVTDTDAVMDHWTRVKIATDMDMDHVVFDSGKMEVYGKPFYEADFVPEAETRYYWQVEIETDKNERERAGAWFETALEGKWQAAWIAAEQEEAEMPCFYKSFSVDKEIASARLYCCGVGLYECYVNSEKAGDEFLMPGYHSYDLNMQYQTYDVTDLLAEGENRISFLLGEGWYKGRFVFEGGYENLYGNRKALTAILKIRYTDGTEKSFCTDEEWRAETTSILKNNIYDGEWIDRTNEKRTLTVEKVEMPSVFLTARYNPPLKKVKSYGVQKIIRTPCGDTVLDFGEAITGWVEVKGNGKMDFYLQYGEVMQQGEFYRENLRTAQAEFHFTGQADDEWLRPHFTYYGFRYVKVVGIEHVKAEDFIAFRLMSDIETTGQIRTSMEKVNQLLDNTYRSQQCNFLDIPLDCPQRDERMGWTGDIGVFARTAAFQMDVPAFLNHYMENLQLEQKELNGAVPFFVPKPKPPVHEGINPFLITAGACAWADAAAIIPWELYLHYQDKKMLESQYPAMCNWVEYIKSRAAENAVPNLWQNDRQLGDWLALDNGNPANPIGSTDSGLIASAYYYYSSMLCYRAAKALEKREDEKKWHLQAESIRKAFLQEYFDEEGDIRGNKTQTAYAILLYFKLYEPEKKEALLAGLKKAMQEYDNHLSTGFVGTGILLQALSENGMEEMAYTLLLHEDYPGWLREINLGATSIWERWNSMNDDGTLSVYGMNSLNHYCYGCVAGWMYEFVCGFRWDEKGFFYLHPLPDKRIEWVEGEYRTTYGTCRIRWSWQEKEKLKITVHVPFQAEIPLQLPWGERKVLRAGNYEF